MTMPTHIATITAVQNFLNQSGRGSYAVQHACMHAVQLISVSRNNYELRVKKLKLT